MRIVVSPGPDGVISIGPQIQGSALPDSAIVVQVEGQTIIGYALADGARVIDIDRDSADPHETLVLQPDGSVTSRYDYRGSGPWYDQQASSADRLTQRQIEEANIVPPNEYGHPVTPGWEHMAMTPRPESAAEKKTREKAEADARAAAEAARKANRVLSPIQIRQATDEMGIRDAIEDLVANPATPRAIRDYWEYSPVYRRSSPVWAQALPLLGATEADLDRLYDIGEAL